MLDFQLMGLKETPYQLFARSEASWGKPNAVGLTEEDVNRVLSGDCSRNLHDERHGDNPCLAGDGVMLLDLDAGKLFRRSNANGTWIPFEIGVYS
jgi:hypothetical protein